MKKKSKKSTAHALQNLKLFSDPKRSRVLWHDAKTFSSASTIYLENMLTGVYGKFPQKLKEPLFNLWSAAVIQMMTLESNSILNKLELNSLELNPKDQLAAVPLKNAIHFLEPVFRKYRINPQLELEEDNCLLLDQRYGSTLLQSILLLMVLLADEKNRFFSLRLKDNQLMTELITTLDVKALQDRISEKHIYSEDQQQASLPALLYWVIAHLSRLSNAPFEITLKNKKITLTYGKA